VSSSDIQSAIQSATEYLAEHPAEARATDTVAIAILVDGLVVQVSDPNGATITTDMVRSVGGTASAPSPGWLLRAAEASCVATLIAMRAAMLGITLDLLEVSVDSVSDDRGLLGIDDSVPAGPLSGRVSVRLTSGEIDAAALEEIARWGIAHCPVCDALERAVPLTIEVITS